MDEFEKVEKLRQRANVSYEEARDALNESNGDLLDAMVYLEKQGKVNPPKSSTYTTDYEQQSQYQDVKGTVCEQQRQANKKTFGSKVKHLFQIIWQTLQENTLHVRRKDVEIMNLPLWAVILILLFAWHFVLVVVIISLFLDCRYHLEKRDGTVETANDVINKASEKASEAADFVKTEFDKL